jgi:proteic killer suppression protein
MAILSKGIKHKGLRQFFGTGKPPGDGKEGKLPAQSIEKIRRQLTYLDTVSKQEDLDCIKALFPGWKYHSLKGNYKGFDSIWVTGNWRIIFKFNGTDIVVMDYVDYHGR